LPVTVYEMMNLTRILVGKFSSVPKRTLFDRSPSCCVRRWVPGRLSPESKWNYRGVRAASWRSSLWVLSVGCRP